jgi:hypothetical protein
VTLGDRHGSTGDPDYRPPAPAPAWTVRAWTDEERLRLAGFDETAARRALLDAHRHRYRPFLQVDEVDHKPLVGHVLGYVAGPLPAKRVLVATSPAGPVGLRYERHRLIARRLRELEQELRQAILERQADP